MSLVGIALLIPWAIALEWEWRLRSCDAQGRLQPSRHEQAVFERFERDFNRHERARREYLH